MNIAYFQSNNNFLKSSPRKPSTHIFYTHNNHAYFFYTFTDPHARITPSRFKTQTLYCARNTWDINHEPHRLPSDSNDTPHINDIYTIFAYMLCEIRSTISTQRRNHFSNSTHTPKPPPLANFEHFFRHTASNSQS